MMRYGLHGHKFKDTIVFHDGKGNKLRTENRLGGIENVALALDLASYSMNYSTGFNYATIMIDVNTGKDIAVCQWDADCKIQEDDCYKGGEWWHHFAYLNMLDVDSEYLMKLREHGTLSCDLCPCIVDKKVYDEKFVKALSCMDYIFVSHKEFEWLNNNIGLGPHQTLICHTADEVYVWDNESMRSFYVKREKFIDIVGAGDFFAGSFMKAMGITSDITYCITYAINSTREFLNVRQTKLISANSRISAALC